MTGIIIAVCVAAVAIAAAVLFKLRRGKVGLAGNVRDLRKLADLRGWHFSRPDSAAETFGLSGESMLRGADGSSLDWRIRWHLRTTRAQGKDKTEFKCADVLLQQGWVFIDPRSHAGEIKARQRAASLDGKSHGAMDDVAGRKHAAWKDALDHAHEVPVGTPEFLGQYFVCATVKEGLVRRLIPQRMQKDLMSAPHSGHLSVRLGSEGVVITCPAEFASRRVEEIIKLGEILISSVAQEQTAGVAIN